MLHKTPDLDVKLIALDVKVIILYVDRASNIFYHTACVCVVAADCREL